MTEPVLTILHLLDHSRPVNDGYALRTHAIMREQQRRGWRPAALTSSKHYESWAGPYTACEEIGGLSYHRTDRVPRSRLPGGPELAVIRSLARRTVDVARATRPHVLHAHSPVLTALAALRVRRTANVPVVYEMRASWEDAAVAVGKYDASSWKYMATRALETYACRRCNHVVVLCEGLKRELTGRGIPAERLTVIPNGVDLEQFQPSQPDPAVAARWGVTGKRIVGFIGSFFHWEGLDVLIDALGLLRRDRHDVVLLLVGGGDRADQLKQQVSRSGLGDAVVFTGAVPPSQVQSMYGIIDVLAYPRHLTRLTDLVTPLKPLEAMAMAKAVVASNVGGHRELIRDNETGLLFTPGDPHALAASLARLIDDDALRQRLQETGHAWVGRERSWSQTTRRYDEVYERLAVGVDSHAPVLEPELECEQRE